jgi:hypothetical protein
VRLVVVHITVRPVRDDRRLLLEEVRAPLISVHALVVAPASAIIATGPLRAALDDTESRRRQNARIDCGLCGSQAVVDRASELMATGQRETARGCYISFAVESFPPRRLPPMF